MGSCKTCGTQTPKQLTLTVAERDNIMKTVVDTLLKSGLSNMTEEIACGIATNIFYESSFNFTAVNSKSGAYGLCQWLGKRQEDLKNFCNSNGYSYDTVDGQVKFLINELSDKENKAYRVMSSPEHRDNVEDCAYECCFWFERPGKNDAEKVKNCTPRRKKADEIYQKYKSM